MRIDHFSIEELNDFGLVDKAMGILTDIQEVTRQIVEQKSNVLVRFEIPFRSAFEEFFEKEGKEIQEKNPSYVELATDPALQEKIIRFSLGGQHTSRKASLFKEAFNEYLQKLAEKKENQFQKESHTLEGVIEDDKLLAKIKDLIEFVYIYRYNKKQTDEVLKLLNQIYQKKYGPQFLQNHMSIYQEVEEKVEDLINIQDKIRKMENMIEDENLNSLGAFVIFYWFYARGELQNLIRFLMKEELPLSFREYILQLIMKRAEMKSEEDRVFDSVVRAKEMVKDIILKLNNREIPVISRNMFEKLMIAGARHFKDYFKTSVVNRIRNNVFNYIKSEMMKNE